MTFVRENNGNKVNIWPPPDQACSAAARWPETASTFPEDLELLTTEPISPMLLSFYLLTSVVFWTLKDGMHQQLCSLTDWPKLRSRTRYGLRISPPSTELTQTRKTSTLLPFQAFQDRPPRPDFPPKRPQRLRPLETCARDSLGNAEWGLAPNRVILLVS